MNGVNGFQGGIQTGMNAFMKAFTTNDAKKAEGAKKQDKANEQKNVHEKNDVNAAKNKTSVNLSERAKALLDKLKEKYDQADIIVASYSSDEEAQQLMASGSKEYSVLIDPELLEKMASDEEEEKKYTGVIDDALSNLNTIQDSLSDEEKENISRIGVSIDKDGNVSYFAELEKSSERQRERIEKSRTEKKEAEKKDAKAAEKEKREEALREKQAKGAQQYAKGSDQDRTLRTTVKADSIESLLDQIRGVDWSQIRAGGAPVSGGIFNYSV